MPVTDDDAQKLLLSHLQDELLQLKQRHGRGGLSLKKATDTASAPFPIQLTTRIDTPASASHCDVSSLRLLLTLADEFLTCRSGLALRVQSDELPPGLCDAIGSHLQHVWADQVAEDSQAGLQGVLAYAQEHYLELLMLLPAVLEAYEGVNDAGATVRRYAFVDAPAEQQQPQEQQQEQQQQQQPCSATGSDPVAQKQSHPTPSPHQHPTPTPTRSPLPAAQAASPAPAQQAASSTREASRDAAQAASPSVAAASKPRPARGSSCSSSMTSPPSAAAAPAAGAAAGAPAVGAAKHTLNPGAAPFQPVPANLPPATNTTKGSTTADTPASTRRRGRGRGRGSMPATTTNTTAAAAVAKAMGGLGGGRAIVPAGRGGGRSIVPIAGRAPPSGARLSGRAGAPAAAPAAPAAPANARHSPPPRPDVSINPTPTPALPPQRHPSSRPPTIPRRPPAAPPSAPPASPLQSELAYLTRRFPSTCTVQPPNAAGITPFTLTLHPTDPTWPPRTPLPLQGHLHRTYPAPASFSLLLPATSPLPRATQQALNTRLQEHAAALSGQATAVRALVKLLENYAGELSKPRQTAPTAAAAPDADQRSAAHFEGTSQRQRRPKERQSGTAGSTSGGSDGSSASWYSDSGSSDGERASDSADVAAGGGPSGVAGGQCYRVALQGCVLEGADALDAIRLSLQVACARCEHASTATLASRAVLDSVPPGSRPFEQLGACPNCAADWGVSLRPEFVHSTSSVLGLLRCAGCAPRDLLPSVLGLQCAQCCEASSLRAVQLGTHASRRCGSCHERVGVRIDAVAFVPVAAPAVPRGGAGGSSRQSAVASSGSSQAGGASVSALAGPHAQLRVGEPLPELGTCRHYRHSHRWLRFPCCGMRFACDLCHEEATDGHEMRWAVRMACGYCSLEQPLGEACTGCGKKLASSARRPTGRSTRFWEGGQGCRDKRSMDSRDAHKWRGSKFKTKSAKHKRVGPKAVPKDKEKAK